MAPEGTVLLQAQGILTELKKANVTHVVGLPDNGSRALYELLWDDPELEVIQVSREGEAFGLASGLYLGGRRPMVVIQNTGLLEAGDAFRGTAYNMRIPLVVLIGYRGYEGLQSGAGRVDTAALFTEPTLGAWNIPHSTLLTAADLGQIPAAFERAAATSLPAALLFAGELS